DAQGRDPPPGRQGRAARLHAGAAEPALQRRARESRDRARQGQGATRQARDRKEARLGARKGPLDATEGRIKPERLRRAAANADLSRAAQKGRLMRQKVASNPKG